ncbi:MAG: polysaccharide biosynthesis C-terminal domain-containing protein [Flavobacteriales bacterium]|nr:polysaccharide biosynthesis C-terminal domain-containing protein [Flavobacteriales bacterium]
MQKRKFLSDLLFVQGLNLLVKIVWILVIDRAVQNLLPAKDYGSYYWLLSQSILFVIFLDMGLQNMNSKLVAQDVGYFKTNFVRFLVAKCWLSLVYVALLLTSGWFLHINGKQWLLLSALAAFQILNSYNQYFRSNLAGMHLFKMDGVLALADRLLAILVLGIWLIVPAFHHLLTIKNFVLVQVLGVAFTFAVGLWLNQSKLKAYTKKEKSLSVLTIIKSSLPYALLITLMVVFTRIDAIMIGNMLNQEETYRYAMSYRLLDAANMMAALFSGMLLPMFAKIITNKIEVQNLVYLSTKILLIPVVMSCIILAPVATPLLAFMFPDKVHLISETTFIYLLFSFIASSSVFIFGTLLTAAHRLKSLNILAAASALLNIILNYLLIPTKGISGAAIATLITQFIFAIGCLIASYKHFEFQISKKYLLKLVVVFGIFTLFYFVLLQFLHQPFVTIMFGILIAILLVVGFGLIGSNTLKLLSRRKTQNASDN